MTEKRIWVDVTELSSWTGNLTGIQRVHLHIGEEFAQKPNVKFFAASATTGIREVDLPTPQFLSETGPKPELAKRSRFAKLLARVFRVSKRMLRKMVPVRRKQQSIGSHPFTSADTVLVLGATWGTPGLPEMLSTLKETVGFTLVYTVYDLIPVYAPHFYGPGFADHYGSYLETTIKASDVLLSISQHTSRDLRRFISELGLPEIPIITFRLGDDPVEHIADSSPSPDIHPGSFVLSVGTVEVRKNHLVLYHAWELAAKQGIELPQLVIVGKPGWNVSDLLYDISMNPLVNKKITILSGIDDAHLGWLYENCLFTVYPSWYEGWGLPVAESLHMGKLCISSDATSMPEIGGDLVEYCSPYSPQDWMTAIARFASNRATLLEAEKRIRHNYTGGTWKQSFEQIWDGLGKL